MPGALPATSAYTYAAEPTADEALAVNGQVTFSQPVSAYVENFLGFPVGTSVPLGTYDRPAAAWQAQPDGRVVKILAVTNGVAAIDADGDGAADSEVALAALGFSAGERAQLAATYQPGATLMRTRLRTFAPFDPNFPFRILGIDPVVVAEPGCASATRDIIKCDVRVASQAVDIPGTPLVLAYSSARAAGAADRSLRIPLTGTTMPAGLLGIYVGVLVSGQVTEQDLAPGANLAFDYTWDGKDAYGRPVQGNPTAVVRIGYRFPLEYQGPAGGGRSFGLSCEGAAGSAVGSCTIPQNRPGATERFSGWRMSTTTTRLGGLDAKAQGLGGFDFNVHHQYDPVARVLYLGDGTTRVADAITPVITTVAGKGLCLTATDSVPATASCLVYPAGAASVLAMPDGGFLVPDWWQVRRVRPDGIIERFAGLNQSPRDFNGNDRTHNPNGTIVGEGGPATGSYIISPSTPALGPGGIVYLADNGFPRILRVAPSGIITRVIGAETGPYAADGMAANVAKLDAVRALAVGLDGALYFVTRNDPNRIYRLGADSVLHVIAGTGIGGVLGDGGPARQARVGEVTSLAVGADGSLYLGQDDVYTGSFRRVRRITPDGVIRTVAGGGGTGADQATPALEFGFGAVKAIAVSADGTVYVSNGDQLEQIGVDGILRRFAGENAFSQGTKANRFGGDGGSARRAWLNTALGLSVTSDGAVLIADYLNGRIRKVAPPMPGFSGAAFIIASEDGSEFYSFDASGRHLSTVSALTRKQLRVFSYDPFGKITTLTDQNGLSTTIARDGTGVPTAIIGPFGHRLALTIDATGNLATVQSNAGLNRSFGFSGDGLLLRAADNTGGADTLTYDASGRVAGVGSGLTMSVVPLPFGSQANIRTVEGLDVKLTYGRDVTGVRSVTRTTNGIQTTALTFPDGSTETRYPDGSLIRTTQAPDPRTGMQSPLVSSTVAMPSGLTSTERSGASVTYNPLDPDEINIETDSLVANGRVTTATYDHIQKRATLTTPAGRTRTLLFDDEGRVIADSVGGQTALRFSLRGDGKPAEVLQGANRWRMDYDTKGNLVGTLDPLGRSTRYAYDAATGAQTSVIAPNGDTTLTQLDPLDRLTAVRGSDGREHRLVYTADDHLAQYQMPDVGSGVSRVTATYDAAGHRTQLIRASGDTVRFEYDSSGRQIAVTSRNVNRRLVPDASSGLLSRMTDGANTLAVT